jgi:hypothetical protein
MREGARTVIYILTGQYQNKHGGVLTYFGGRDRDSSCESQTILEAREKEGHEFYEEKFKHIWVIKVGY